MMQMCQMHWERLHHILDEKGVGHLGAKDGKEAMDNLVEELNTGVKDLSKYDPLMDCNNMISGRAIECGGLYLLSGNYCPLCEAVKHGGDGLDEQWLSGCTDAVAEYCRSNGLITKIQ